MANGFQAERAQDSGCIDPNSRRLNPLATANEQRTTTTELAGSTLTLFQAWNRCEYLKAHESKKSASSDADIASEQTDSAAVRQADGIAITAECNQKSNEGACKEMAAENEAGTKLSRQHDNLSQSSSRPSKRINIGNETCSLNNLDCENEDDDEELPSGVQSREQSAPAVSLLQLAYYLPQNH